MRGVLLDALTRLPSPIQAALAAVLGDAWFYLLRIRREVALSNLSNSSIDPGEGARQRLVRRSCRHLVRNVLELPRLVGAGDERFFEDVRVEGEAHLRDAFESGRGVLVVTAHLGNWELLGAVASHLGYPAAMVIRPLAGSASNRWIEDLRIRSGVSLVEEGPGELKQMCRTLRDGKLLGFTIDQRPLATRRSVPIPFLGRPARVTTAVATLALRTGAPIVPVVIHREPNGRHRVRVGRPLYPHRDGRPLTLLTAELASAYHRFIEEEIAQHPDQWLWQHRRWRAPVVQPEPSAP